MSKTAITVLLLASLAAQGCIERWVYVDLQSLPPGAKVRSKGLPAPHAVTELTAPGGHFLRCSIDAISPELQVKAESWSYVFSKADHNDEEVFVERAKVAKRCADSQQEARAKPYLVRAALLASTSEQGLRNAVVITTSPAGANVVDETTGKVLGKTPFRTTYVFYAPYKQEYPVRLELAGYVPLKRKVTVNTLVFHGNLYRPGETPPPQPPPKAKSRPVPTPPGP